MCLYAKQKDFVNFLLKKNKLKVLLQSLCLVGCLPWKIKVGASEMSVCSGATVDRSAQVKHLDDSSRAQVEVLTNDRNQLLVRKSAGSKGIHHDR